LLVVVVVVLVFGVTGELW